MARRVYLIWIAFLTVLPLCAQSNTDSVSIYQGTQLKLDLGSAILEMTRSGAKVQTYEIAANVNLLQRYFPTLELGYAQAYCPLTSGTFSGKGGFARVGVDLSSLKKSLDSPNKLLIGIRVGTAVQDYTMANLTMNDTYWQLMPTTDIHKVSCDVWGEVVAGIQVQVYKAFYMGLAARLKILFTRGEEGQPTAYYIPGYGYKDDMNFGFNYYLGWQF